MSQFRCNVRIFIVADNHRLTVVWIILTALRIVLLLIYDMIIMRHLLDAITFQQFSIRIPLELNKSKTDSIKNIIWSNDMLDTLFYFFLSKFIEFLEKYEKNGILNKRYLNKNLNRKTRERLLWSKTRYLIFLVIILSIAMVNNLKNVGNRNTNKKVSWFEKRQRMFSLWLNLDQLKRTSGWWIDSYVKAKHVELCTPSRDLSDRDLKYAGRGKKCPDRLPSLRN